MMQPSRYRWVAALAVLSLLIAGYNIARATPLTDGFATQPGNDSRPARPLSEAEIVDTATLRPQDGLLSPAAVGGVVQQYLGNAGETGNSWARDKANSFELGAGIGSPLEIFRSMVNVPKGTPRNTAPRPGGGSEDGLPLGLEARELIDETVRGIVNSVVELKTNEQGRTSFSVLGMGDFGIMVSGDRNEVALVEGEAVLLTANRLPPSAQSAGASFQEMNTVAYLPGGSASATGEYSMQRLLDTVQETASHPLSLLVYAIVIVFVVLWNILSMQANQRPAPAARESWHNHPNQSAHTSPARRRVRRSRRR